MSPTVRRVAAPPPPPAQSGGTVNFFQDGFFSGGLGLPEGNYACTFHFQMFQPRKKDGTPTRTAPFLAAMLTAYPIDPQSGALLGDGEEIPLSCGQSAHESFMPSEDGKGLMPVPNGKSSGMWNLSSFGYFMDSLKNAGLPTNLGSNDFSVLDGVWLHLTNVPEPEEKKAASRRARAKTGASAMQGGPEEEERDRTMLIVSEILENGKPWEGTGGIPDGAEAPAAAPAPPAAVRGKVATMPARGKVAPVAAPPAEIDEQAVGEAALAAVSEVLAANPGGLMTVALKTQAFAACVKASGEDIANLVMEQYIKDDATFSAVIDELGYKKAGLKTVVK